jgi:hypothetical protein
VWVLQAWESGKKSVIVNGFRKATEATEVASTSSADKPEIDSILTSMMTITVPLTLPRCNSKEE